MQHDRRYSLPELCDRAEVTPRTVRYYVAQGLLPGPSGSGAGSRYGERHLARLRLIRRLQREHLPLAEIRTRLAALSDQDVAELAVADDRPADAAGQPESALEYVRSILTGGPAKGGPLFAIHVGQAPKRIPPPRFAVAHDDIGSPPFRARAVGHRAAERPEAISPASSDAIPSDVPAAAPAPQASAAQPPDRSQWDRVALTPDVELHIRRPLSRVLNRRVDRLIAIARELLEED